MGDSQRTKPEDFSEAADRIVQTIANVFKRDSEIDEFDLVPAESQSNRSPVIHIDHKLALESWCVPILYAHSFKSFLELSGKKVKTFVGGGIAKSSSSSTNTISPPSSNWDLTFRDGRYSPNPDFTEQEKLLRKINLTRLLVLLSPDLLVAWNFRRSCVIGRNLKWSSELKLAALVLTRKPKSSDTFAYRRWLVSRALESPELDADEAFKLYQEEIRVSELCATASFSNYHAWTHRQWTLSTFLSLILLMPDKRKEMLKAEIVASDHWIQKHVSDHSGFHYREFLILTAFQEPLNHDDSGLHYMSQLELNAATIMRYPGHQTLWYHRRFILFHAIQYVVGSNSLEMKVNSSNDSSSPADDSVSTHTLKHNEEILVNCVLSESAKRNAEAITVEKINFISKESVELNVYHANQHCKWAHLILGWQIK